LPKPAASRGSVCALCVVPLLAVVSVALLAFSPAAHRSNAGAAPAGAFATQARTVAPAARGRMQASYAALPLAFEQNQGQADAPVKYLARGSGYMLFLTGDDAVFSLRSPSAENRTSAGTGPGLQAEGPRQGAPQKYSTAVVRMRLAGGNSLAKVAASDLLPGKSNYYLGDDPSKWRTDVARYARVSYQNVYPGVNLAYHGAQRQLEFDFVVAPGANPAPIGLQFTGAAGIRTDDSGNLIIASTAGNVLLHKPVAYQEQHGARQAVDARFTLKAGNQVRFELGNYDHSRELVIDPAVTYEYSTYLGGTGDDEGEAIAFDSSGNAYVAGETASPNFPGATNALNDAASVFVTKIAANGSSLVYSVYVGGTGSGTDTGYSLAVDASGDAFVTGGTSSTNFPHTTGVFQTSLKGTTGNAFVFELAPTGTLTYSTYLGGTGTDTAFSLALASGASGDVYVAGQTSSTNFPTQDPLQGYLTGSTLSGFLTKLNSTGTALVYSTYLGGSSTGDKANGVAVDSSDNAYVIGQTFSSTFITTKDVVQTNCGSCSDGNSNAFVTVINPAGSAYIYSTFLGGNNKDIGIGIAVDSSGDAYVTGGTESSDFPTTKGAVQTSYGGNTDAFVTELNPTGTALLYSTYLGGGGYDEGAGIAVDGSDNAYVTGQTNSTTPTPFPTVGATQAALAGGYDAFVSEIKSTGSQLVFSTYLGGAENEDDGGNYAAIAVDSLGQNIYVTGNTASTNFPTSGPAPYTGATANGGGTDAFVVKYAQGQTFNIVATTPAAVSPGTSGTSTVALTGYNGYNFSVNLSCSVSGSGSSLPACSTTSFSTNPQTPAPTPGATSTLTITTTGNNSAMLVPGKVFYAMWLAVAGLSLAGMGFSSSRSRGKRLLGFLMVAMVMAALFLMPACGSSSSSGGGGGGGCTGCTPAGSYTVTITGTGTDANAVTQSTQVTLTVN
jgi:hypothetical protein